MKRKVLCLSLALLCGFPASIYASPVDIGWEDLQPPVATIDNPFDALTPHELDNLRQIFRLESAGDSPESKLKIQALREQMATSGLDVDALFAKRDEIIESRRMAAEMVSDEFIGKEVRLPGYLLPLEFDGTKAVEFLLVPTVGACIHTPPPPANQVVHVRYPQGFEVEGLYTAVWVTGTLGLDKTLRNVRYADGQSDVMVSYAITPDLVTAFEP